MAIFHLHTPLVETDVRKLRSGDLVLLSGPVYTARDAAHKRLMALLDAGEPLPFPAQGAAIYYVGPTPPPDGRPIGAAGPTTSCRLDFCTPRLHSLGVRATIGKGKRDAVVREALCRFGGVYLGATGGAGALISMHITASRMLAFPDLGTEAIRELILNDLPLLVLNDSVGGDLYARPDLAAVGLEPFPPQDGGRPCR